MQVALLTRVAELARTRRLTRGGREPGIAAAAAPAACTERRRRPGGRGRRARCRPRGRWCPPGRGATVRAVMTGPLAAATRLVRPRPRTSAARESRTACVSVESATTRTSPPRPPSPPSGPPSGTYFSRRKLTAPRPPDPAATSMSTSSMKGEPRVAVAQPVAATGSSSTALRSSRRPRRSASRARWRASCRGRCDRRQRCRCASAKSV